MKSATFAVVAAAGLIGAVVTAGRTTEARAELDETARVELGRRLFFDPAIGRRGKVACAACHDPEHGFSDAKALSLDETGFLPRHSQPLVDLAGDGFHWDGEFETVRDVIDARIAPGLEPTAATAARMLRRIQAAAKSGGADAAILGKTMEDLGVSSAYYGPVTVKGAPQGMTIASRITREGRYDMGFRAAFGDAKVTPQRVGDALEAYLRSLTSTASPFDAFLRGDEKALGKAARRGWDTFRGKAGCAQCHLTDGATPRFTDGKFHNTGIAVRHAKAAFTSTEDPGRVAATFLDSDRGRYKTPSLRDVARRAPYFHDASSETLSDVVRYYAAGGTANAHLDEKIRAVEMTDADVADVVAFLESLTGYTRPGLGQPGTARARQLTIRAENLDGTPAARVPVLVRPSGDRLAGTARMPSPVAATTGADGNAVVDMPLSTHVRVECAGTVSPALLPDWTQLALLLRVPKDKVALTIRFPTRFVSCPDECTASPGTKPVASMDARFVKVRDIGPGIGLYTTDAAPDRSGTTLCALRFGGSWLDGPQVSIDFSPGSSNEVALFVGNEPDSADTREAIGVAFTAIRDVARQLTSKR